MKTVFLDVAGFIIKINFHQAEGKYFREELIKKIDSIFKGFITQKKSPIDFTIDFIEIKKTEIILRNHKKAFFYCYFYRGGKKISLFYQISLFQFQIVFKNILHQLLCQKGGFMLHASAVKIDDRALVFVGRPGAGKSTAMRFLSSRYQPLADDSIIIKKEKNDFYLYQTPFIETNMIDKNSNKYQIKQILFLKKDICFKIKRLKKEKAVEKLLRQVLTEKESFKTQAKDVLRFINMSNFGIMSFPKDQRGLIEFIEKIK